MPVLTRKADRALDRFADWFASRGGVWETTIVVLVWTVIACIWRPLDPNLFRTMAILTVYSAVTQPILAYCNRRVAEKTDRDSAALKAEEDAILAAVQVQVSCPHCQEGGA